MIFRYFRTAILIVLVLVSFFAASQNNVFAYVIKKDVENSPPPLLRGTNIAGWLTQTNRKIYLRDAFEIKKAGFDFVRLPVEPQFFHYTLDGAEPAAKQIDFTQVDNAIALMNSAGLAVVLDFHPQQEFKLEVEKGGEPEDRFVEFWAALADHYRKFSPHALAYQLLNEPQYYNKEAQWDALQRRLVAAVRKTDKDHLIIVSAPNGSSVDGLLKMATIDDARIAYDFHFYEPYIVTHQGAWWFGDSQIRYLMHVPYPSSLVDKSKIAVSKGGNLDEAIKEVNKYTSEDWNAAKIESRIAKAADWEEQHHVRLLNLEFGVLLTRTDPDSRYRWISDVHQSFDKHHIGWAVFDYTDSFAIITPNGDMTDNPDGSTQWTYPENASRTIDPAARKALGLKPATTIIH